MQMPASTFIDNTRKGVCDVHARRAVNVRPCAACLHARCHGLRSHLLQRLQLNAPVLRVEALVKRLEQSSLGRALGGGLEAILGEGGETVSSDGEG